MNEQYPEERAEDVDLQTKARDRADLLDIIRKPLRPERLEDYARVSATRAEIVGASVWGHIRWHKSFGRPNTPRLSDGFDIVHSTHILVITDTPDGERGFDIDSWLDVDFPISKWDSQDDENFYVSFRSPLITVETNKVAVRFTKNSQWIRGEGISGVGARSISPPEQIFNKKGELKRSIFLEFVINFI